MKITRPLRLDAGGVVRVGKSRVTLDSVFFAFLEGATAEEIVMQFPSLDLADVYRTLAFCLDNEAEVRSYMQARNVEAEDLQAKVMASENMSKLWRRLTKKARGAA